MNIMKKICVLLMLLIISINFMISQKTLAAVTYEDYDTQIDSLINDDYTDNTKTDLKVNNITGTVITVVRIIGVGIAIIMLLVIAMKYMMAAPGEKADIKKSAIAYVVGAIVLFGATGLLGIISQFSSGIK